MTNQQAQAQWSAQASAGGVEVVRVTGRATRRAFIEAGYALTRDDPADVPMLRTEMAALLDPAKNPWFEHGEAQLFLAKRDGRVVGRISAHIDRLALAQPAAQGFGPGTGNFGLFEAADAAVAHALLAAAEDWLEGQGMTRVLGPMSLSIWDEPGLLIAGHDMPPTIMLGHDRAAYQDWIEAAGYRPVKQLWNYGVAITDGFPPIVQRIVAAGEKSPRITIRQVDKRRFDAEARLILGILNDAWSDNWGFVPLTDAEIAHVGKKLRPIVFEDLIRVAEVDGEAVAFMIVLPDMNELLIGMDGRLLPFNWLRLLRWLRRPRVTTMRVPLMGVVKRLQNSRMASQLAFMMIEFIRRDAIDRYGASRGDIGWVLDDNHGMIAVADAIGARINRVYQLYGKPLI